MNLLKSIFQTHEKAIYLLISSFSLLVLIFALFSQYYLDMQPCPWCILQRLIFVLIFIYSSISFFIKNNKLVKTIPIILLSLVGITTALYQNLVAAKSMSCRMSFAEKLIESSQLDTFFPYVFSIKSSCADSAVQLLFLPYEIWSLLSFLLIGFIVLLKIKLK